MSTTAQDIAKIQAENNQMYRDVAREQMDFQLRMSSSAHQREIADLKAAGLNPILSAGSGGATTPSGSQADVDTSSLVSYLINEMNNENAQKLTAQQVAAQKYAADMAYRSAQVAANAQIYAVDHQKGGSFFDHLIAAVGNPNSVESRAFMKFLNAIGIHIDTGDVPKNTSSGSNTVSNTAQDVTNPSVILKSSSGTVIDNTEALIKAFNLYASKVEGYKNKGWYASWNSPLVKLLRRCFDGASAKYVNWLVYGIGLYQNENIRKALNLYYRRRDFYIPKYLY